MLTTQTSGISFPIQLSSGRHSIISGVDLIQNSIMTILSWPLGTKQFLGEFGSRSHELLESPNDNVLMTLVRKFVIDSLRTWEKRIEIVELKLTRPSEEKLVVDLSYKIKDLNVVDNIKYTYYTT